MATDFLLGPPAPEAEVLDALPGVGLSRHDHETDGTWAATDGERGYLWADVHDGMVVAFTRYGASEPDGVVEALERAGLHLVCEEDDEYWDLAGE
jgi:hypothetical protein